MKHYLPVQLRCSFALHLATMWHTDRGPGAYVGLPGIGMVSDASFFTKKRSRTRPIDRLPTKPNLRPYIRAFTGRRGAWT